MATLTIRQLDDAVYDRLKSRAKSNHRSLEAEVRSILSEQATDVAQMVGQMRGARLRFADKYGAGSDSVALVRAIRNEE